MTGVGRRGVAAGVWAVAWLLVAVSVAVRWAADLPADPLPGIFLSQAATEIRTRADDIDVAVALVYGPVAALVLARRPHPVGVILALHATGSALAAFGLAYGLLGAEHPGLPAWGLLAHAGGWAFVPGTFLTAALPFLITHERLGSWSRSVVGVCVGLAVTATAVSMTQQGDGAPSNPLAIRSEAYQDALPSIYTAASLLALAISVLGCAVLVARLRGGDAGVGLAWLATGQLILTLSYLVQAMPEEVGLPRWVLEFGLATPVLGQILYPAAIVVVVLGQRLWGVDLVVSRVLLWVLLSFSGVVLYLVLVAAVPAALAPEGSWALLVPVGVALAVLPLRGWLQRRIDHLVYGEGADASTLLVRLGDRIGELPPGPEGLQDLARTLRRVLRLGWVEIEAGGLRAGSGSRTAANVVELALPGAADAGALRVQAVPGLDLDRRTRSVLDDVVGLVATAAGLARSYLVLDAARAALVARRAQERRAIRRELHDGLGPALAGIGFGLAAVENLAPTDPARARALLAELGDDVHRRVAEARDLAVAVAAPRVEPDDLPDELRVLVDRFSATGRRVRLDVRGVEHLSPAVADAMYFIGAEALSNAARHAEATQVAVRIAATSGVAELAVVDDGRGVRPDSVPGVGMASMRERASEVGGRLVVASGSGGTTIRLQVAGRPSRPKSLRDGPGHDRIEDTRP